MKSTILGVFGLLVFATSIFGQFSPTPVINNEMRDISSTRRRAMELERITREANKPFGAESNEEANIRFVKVKEDFESIQKLEAEIIKAYTTEKQINHQKISESAAEMSKNSIRLEANLFNVKFTDDPKNDKKKPPGVRDLIIELDKAIGDFINNPIFKDNKVIKQKDVEKSQAQLEKVIKLSNTLSQEAKKML